MDCKAASTGQGKGMQSSGEVQKGADSASKCGRRFLGNSFLKLLGLEFPAYCVARVELNEMLPLLRQVI